MSTIGDRIKRLIEENSLSQNRLAQIVGVSGASVSAIINGRNKPDFNFLENLLHHFQNLNADWLIKGQGPMYKDLLIDDTTSNSIVAEPKAEYIKTPTASVGAMLDKKMEWMEQQILELTKQVARLQSA